MGTVVVRRDHPHLVGGAGGAGNASAEPRHLIGLEVDACLARLVGEGKHVLSVGSMPAGFRPALEAQSCRTVESSVANLAAHRDEGPFDAVVVTGILGRTSDPRALLSAVKEQLRPEGTLIVALGGVSAVGERLAMIDGEPLGAGSGVLFTEDGLVSLLEQSEFAVGHIEWIEEALVSPGTSSIRDCCIVAHPLPIPGLDYVQRRMRALAQEGEEARREADALRQHAAVCAQRLEMLAGQEQRMAARIQELRSRLLDTHAQSIHRDDEIRKTFGDAIYQRNALYIERDTLAGQRDALLAEREIWVAERRALQDALHSAQGRLDRLRRSPVGLVYRVLRKLILRGGRRGRAQAMRV